jgi:hypothetical protein
MRRRTGGEPPRFPRLFSSLPGTELKTAHGTRRRKAATGAARPETESIATRSRPPHGHTPGGGARKNEPTHTHGTNTTRS